MVEKKGDGRGGDRGAIPTRTQSDIGLFVCSMNRNSKFGVCLTHFPTKFTHFMANGIHTRVLEKK